MGDLQFQEVKEEQKNNEHLWTIEKVINDDIFAPEYEPPYEIFNLKINKVKCQMSKNNKVKFDGAYLRSSSGHFFSW